MMLPTVRNPTHEGINWTALRVPGQPIILGLGGIGVIVNMGELSLTDLAKPQIATLTLGMHNLDPSQSFGYGNIQAQIGFGVGAANEQILIDWGTQSSICLPCGKLNINAIEADGHPPAGQLNIKVPIMLTAQLAAGPRSSLGWPTLTFSRELPAGVPISYQPPKRAKRLLVGDPRPFPTSDVEVNFRGLRAVTTFLLAQAADSAIRTEGVVIPGTTESITFTSPGGLTNPNRLTICFLLDG